jgi:hypothetical protein
VFPGKSGKEVRIFTLMALVNESTWALWHSFLRSVLIPKAQHPTSLLKASALGSLYKKIRRGKLAAELPEGHPLLPNTPGEVRSYLIHRPKKDPLTEPVVIVFRTLNGKGYYYVPVEYPFYNMPRVSDRHRYEFVRQQLLLNTNWKKQALVSL